MKTIVSSEQTFRTAKNHGDTETRRKEILWLLRLNLVSAESQLHATGSKMQLFPFIKTLQSSFTVPPCRRGFLLPVALLLIMLFVTCSGVHAAVETSTNRISGASLNNTSSVTAVDNKYNFIAANPSTYTNSFNMASGVGRVRVGFDHSSLNYVGTAYNYSFTVQIKYQDQTLSAPSTITTTLTAVYDPAAMGSYQDAALYEVATANKIIWVNATITSIYDNIGHTTVSDVPDNMYLEASTVAERFYVLNYNATPVPSTLSYLAPNTTNYTDTNEVQVYWNHINGAEQYQLEWTYINDYNISGSTQSTDSLTYDFTHNSTRITTTQQHFNIPLIFDKGYLLFRVRAATKAYDSGSSEWKWVYGKWTTDTTNAGNTNTVTHFLSLLSGHAYHITHAHEKEKNWQYVGTFAEEGKKKEVVSYYDGSLRNRQTVTKTSTDKKILIGETFYDFQGRAAVTALPAPLEGDDKEIAYYPGFNLVDSSAVNKGYSRYDFDIDASACTTPTLAMKTSAGASNYYSTSNAEMDNAQAFLPDAKKYPFAQVEYMPDNTGRIRQQGGVGPDHQLSSNHQTRYFYAQPAQEELDRLFGSDAGYKKHYNKTVTLDANGQASVTYLDQEGRTVATALAGKNPYNLLPLKNSSGDTLYNTNLTVMSVDLLGKDSIVNPDTDADDNIRSSDGKTLSVNTQLAVPFAQTYSFAYSLTGEQFHPDCLPDGICYQCVYDLTIEIRDQCGNAYGGTPLRRKVGSFSTDCSDGNATFTLTPGSLNVRLPIGSYTITKTLSVNEDTLNKYLEDYLAQSDCVRTLSSFIDSASAHIDSTGCHVNSTENTDYISPCEASYLMMLSDVSPMGQYAQFLVNGTPAPTQYPLSVLNSGSYNYLPHGNTSNWHHPLVNGSSDHYYEADGTTVSRVTLITIDASTYDFDPPIQNTGSAHSNLTIVDGDYTIEPQYLDSVVDFISAWKESWATSLVEYHPEYCYYNWCKVDTKGTYTGYDTLSSDEYDSLLLSTTTIAGAHLHGLLNPFGNAYSLPNQANCKDPYFRAHGAGHSQYNQLLLPDACEYARHFQHTSTGADSLSIWKYAKMMTSCGTTYGSLSDVNACLTSALGSLPSNDTLYIVTDDDWMTFRSLYLSIKQHFQALEADSSAKACGGYNGCIGNPGYDPFAAGMITSPILSSPFATDPSPCGGYYSFYAGKVQRYPNVDNLVSGTADAWAGSPTAGSDSLANNAAYNFYEQTGQCPGAFALQHLLNALNDDGNLKGTSIAMVNYPEFTQSMYDVVNGGHPSSFNAISYTGSGSSATLTCAFSGAGTSCTSATLVFPAGTYTWSGLGSSFRVLDFSNLQSTGSGSFTVVAGIDTDLVSTTNGPVYVTLTGTDGCFDVSCSFPNKCEANATANELFTLMNLVATNGDFYNTSAMAVNVTTGTYGNFFNNSMLHSILGSGAFYWQKVSSTHFRIFNGTSNIPSLNIEFTSALPSSVTSFSALTIGAADTTANALAYNGSNTAMSFSLDFHTSSGGGATRNLGVHLGTCGQSTPIACEGEEFQRRADLQSFLNHLAVTGNLANGSPTNLYTDPFFPTSLSSVLGPTSYHYTNSVSGDSLLAPILNDTTLDTACTVYMHFDAAHGSNHWTDVNKITNLVADIDNMHNGVAYDFKATAWFTDNSSVAVTGYSCWGIRNCTECISSSANTYQNFDNFNSGAPGFTTTLTYTVTCPGTGKYTVTQNASGLCNDTTISGNDHTQPGAGKYLYTAYSNNGAQTLWSTTTSVAAFTSYNMSAYYMNLTIDSGFAQHNVTLELWANSTLVASTLVSDTTGGTWQKLAGVWNGKSTAGSITIEIKTSGSGTRNTKLGLDDIGFYTQGCGPKPVLFPADTTPSYPYCDSCGQNTINIAVANGNAMYQQYLDSVKADFRAKYIKHCMDSVVEIFTRTDTLREYHYTLYYYDQGGNLVRTVPPSGVVPINLTTYGQTIKHERAYRTAHPTAAKTFYTSHTMATTYTYNTLNQLVQQVTPDGDTSRFYYDKLGRIVASQNAKQKAFSTPRYSYTVYDAQGRIKEVGELATSNNLQTASFATQQLWLNDYNYPDLLDGAAVSSGNLRYQVTKTFYDEIKFSSAAARFSNATQQNLRKRVASAAIYETYNGSDPDYDNATHYSYDLHGNVQELEQENPELNDLNDISNGIYQTFKRMQYTYDLVSGKVNELWYNKGFADQYFYKYEYDADNRVTAAYTSTGTAAGPQIIEEYDRDAKYFYYKHGPLARTEIGQDKVQGMDYAYTLHGWIKGVNSNKLTTAYDMGTDADVTFTTNNNRYVCADQFGYSLTYYDTTGHTDYTAIGGGGWSASQSGSGLRASSSNLWNGNIKNMVTSIAHFDTVQVGKAFQYDQLNRIIQSEAFINFNAGSNSWNSGGALATWKERFTYDENGNITKLIRHGGKVSTPMDSLDYHYNSGTNQLNYVDDGISSGTYTDDIDDQASGNYNYDKIGNLVKDVSQEIDTIKWNVYGKITDVIRTTTSSKSDLHFAYDAMGNRVCKIVKPRAGSGILGQENWTYTYYERDAQGNILATYDRIFRSITGGFSEKYNLKENDLYGSSRTGIRNTSLEVANVNLTTSGHHSDQTLNVIAVSAGSGTALSTTIFNHKLGEKSYELVNHLGNVLVTVSDMRTANHASTTVTGFNAVVSSATDYYAFGSVQAGRSYMSSNYKYGQNGQEKDDEITGSYGTHYSAQFWEYDARLGRRLNQDPKSNESTSPYSCYDNNPLCFVDIKGDTSFRFDSEGFFIGTHDDGKAEWSIETMKMEQKTNSEGYLVNELVTDKIYMLNDPENDVSTLKYLTGKYSNSIPLLYMKTSVDLGTYVAKSGVDSPDAQDSPYSYAKDNSGPFKPMDNWGSYLKPEMAEVGIDINDIETDRGAFYIYEGDNRAFNAMDFGNALWGLEMRNLEFTPEFTLAAAHGHQFFIAHRDYGQGGWLDAPGDQRAIAAGYTCFHTGGGGGGRW